MKYAKIAGFGLVLLILAGLLSIPIKREFEHAGDWAYWSCLLSVEQAIRYADPDVLLGITSVDGGWHVGHRSGHATRRNRSCPAKETFESGCQGCVSRRARVGREEVVWVLLVVRVVRDYDS